MLTAVDSSILLDLLCGATQEAERAEEILSHCMHQGALIMCECVLAEIRPALSEPELREFVSDWQIQFIPGSLESALLAGRMFEAYLKRGGTRNRVVADFLIGAHAMQFAKRLCARDRGYWRDYFKDLEVISSV